jgi:hypothetical protein
MSEINKATGTGDYNNCAGVERVEDHTVIFNATGGASCDQVKGNLSSIPADGTFAVSDSAGYNTDGVGGYEFTGAFTDRSNGGTGSSAIGTDVQYTSAQAASGVFRRFGMDSATQLVNDQPYWTDPTPAPAAGVGLFGGAYMPAGVNKLFDFGFSDPNFSDATTGTSLDYTAATGSLDFSQCQAGDLLICRFSFNVTPQVANSSLEVGLIWQTRDANGNPTFTFFLAAQPQFYGQGSTGRTFLSRPLITAYFASNEDVRAKALPAIRCDQQILIQPLSMLATIVR